MILLEYILLLSPLIAHVAIDYKGTVKHGMNAVLMVGIAFVAAMVLRLFGHQIIYSFIYSLCIHFAFFDFFYNITHGHRWNHLGKTAWTDRQMGKLPVYGQVFIRLWFLLVGIGVFHYSELL